MSENKHTPEPWRTDAECGFPQDIHDAKGNLLLRCGSDFDNEIYGEANARRIVACVNACAGSSTEWLEFSVSEDRADLSGPFEPIETRITSILKTGLAYMVERNQMKMQRDELLAALERFMDSHEECTDFDGFTAQIVSMADYHQAQDAIASVKELK